MPGALGRRIIGGSKAIVGGEMSLLLSGLSIFLILHLATVTPALRGALVAVAGQSAWKGTVALGSLAAIVLIVAGWGASPATPLFAPSAVAVRLAPPLVSLALVLFVIGGAGLPGHIRFRLRHPMLIGVGVWSATHLLANGGLRETLVFGTFLAFSVYALSVLLFSGKRARFVPAVKWDLVGIGIGLFVAVGVMHGHRWLFGVAVG